MPQRRSRSFSFRTARYAMHGHGHERRRQLGLATWQLRLTPPEEWRLPPISGFRGKWRRRQFRVRHQGIQANRIARETWLPIATSLSHRVRARSDTASSGAPGDGPAIGDTHNHFDPGNGAFHRSAGFPGEWRTRQLPGPATLCPGRSLRQKQLPRGSNGGNNPASGGWFRTQALAGGAAILQLAPAPPMKLAGLA